MANGIDWLRWHHGTAADPKFGLVAKKAGARFGDVVTVWALILEQASASVERGSFDPLDPETTDFMLGAEEGTTARILAAMELARGLTEAGRVVRWEERQPKREREQPDTTAAERKRQQRARESEQSNVTPSHATSHQETPREEKSREEEIKPKAKSRACAATASRLPADWLPTDGDSEYCKTKRPDLLLTDVADRFRDYWLGSGGKKVDWNATWRNWVQNERRIQTAGPPGYQTANDKAKTWADRITGKTRNEQPRNIIDINERPP